MSKSTVKITASKARKFNARKTRALSVRGNKKKFTEMVNPYSLTEKMAVKLLTVCKL